MAGAAFDFADASKSEFDTGSNMADTETSMRLTSETMNGIVSLRMAVMDVFVDWRKEFAVEPGAVNAFAGIVKKHKSAVDTALQNFRKSVENIKGMFIQLAQSVLQVDVFFRA